MEEGRVTAKSTVVLTSQPTANVTVGLTSSDLTEGTVAPSSVTFTSVNWNVAQTVTVTGVDDAMADGPIAYTIVTAPALSTDGNYDNRNQTGRASWRKEKKISVVAVTLKKKQTTTGAGGDAKF